MKKLLCIALICLLLCGCSGTCMAEDTVFAMDTVMQLQVWAEDVGHADGALGAVRSLLRRLESTWSAVDADSPLSRYNRGEDPGWDQEETAFLLQLEALSEKTGGAFDPKLGSVSAAWGFYDDTHRVPSGDEIAAALAKTTWDVGAALKGHAGKLAVAELEKGKVICALLNLGGNVQTFGTKPDGSPWKIGIQSPDGNGTLGVLSVEGTMAVVTSGDYQRFFELDGKKYHHILNPETGYPADSGLRSVTVICEDGLLADVYSTALFVMGLEEATAFWRENGGFEAVFVLSDNSVLATREAKLSGCEFEVIGDEE